jgi:RimJ/RimL family protein N-acetyltransferase
VDDHPDGDVRTFDYQPFLEGDLLIVRPLRADDYAALFAAASDPLIWEQHPEPGRHREDSFRAFFDSHLDSGGALAVCERGTGEIIGTSRFHGYDASRSEVEIGWTFLTRSHWGGAYNGELKRLMLEHAFRFVDSVVFLVHPDNVRSRRAVEKLGAALVGPRQDAAGRQSLAFRVARH